MVNDSYLSFSSHCLYVNLSMWNIQTGATMYKSVIYSRFVDEGKAAFVNLNIDKGSDFVLKYRSDQSQFAWGDFYFVLQVGCGLVKKEKKSP